jgi:hypothetical protein
VNTIEFSLRENNTGSFPRGLSLMLRAVGAWIYGRDPYTPIQVRRCCKNALSCGRCGGCGLQMQTGRVDLRQGPLHTHPGAAVLGAVCALLMCWGLCVRC